MTTWTVSIVGEYWTRDYWSDVESDVRHACRETVLDCEQEINEGGYFTDDDPRPDALTNALYIDAITSLERQLRWHPTTPAVARVAPWYAVAQHVTFTITVKQEG